MIRLWAGVGGRDAGSLVAAALRRSVGMQQVDFGQLGDINCGTAIAVVVSPDETEDLLTWCAVPGRKLIVLGALPANVVRAVGAVGVAPPDPGLARSSAAVIGHSSESGLHVRYTALVRSLSGQVWRRPFERFDFADEWNNHGYGAIRADDSIWAAGARLSLPPAAELAFVAASDGVALATYAALLPLGGAHVLWFDRPVGPIDSFEWCLVEHFLAHYAAATHACQPVISEIPFGYDTAITMRLDCDEDAASARPLLSAYRQWGVPFSVAVHAPVLAARASVDFVRDVGRDGSVLSHSLTHAPAWGGTLAQAIVEAAGSAAAVAQAIGARPANAVSPFHQSPDYAIRALAECGYTGCIGGTIREFPETVTARGGAIAGHPASFVFHAQQCMLHGDCMLGDNDPIAGYRAAFDLAYASASLFAYLDHPFSVRYAYGWRSEDFRTAAHSALLEHIRTRVRHPLFLNEDAALSFLRGKSSVDIRYAAGVFHVAQAKQPSAFLSYAISYRGEYRRLDAGGLRLAAGP